ncbi:hypothetical protein [Antrihabitans stalactiti]|uniref:Uncharacterized protein n=1 Tax=Antrihabitans stalactiti TaxID=2584121 RepID=A0A848KEP2_9NOCA|nr:hypothetical protein [Antrihabitans stalactiti]NMN96206.1 hypothetical protein [Antrihabitans stalactiti]
MRSELPPGSESDLEAVAFGADPGRARLMPAVDARSAWLRAVALGGQGHYGRARSELRAARSLAGPDRSLQSLIVSTEASLLRQLGWHRTAAQRDGAALALLNGVSSDTDSTAARCDGFTGLAADALGVGRFALGHRLIQRCDEMLDAAGADQALWRQHIRRQWVGAELALGGGDARRAMKHAQAAKELSDTGPSVRHRVKSSLLVAACFAASDRLAEAHSEAREVVDQSARFGLIPLRWAAAMLLAGTGCPNEIAAASASLIFRRGGRFYQP